MDNIVKAHNAKILLKEDKKDEEEKGCNCRDKAACPVANKCLKTNVVYKATVQYDDKTEHYIGMTENTFKTRYALHKSSLRHSKNRNQTELSNLIWFDKPTRELTTSSPGKLLTKLGRTSPESVPATYAFPKNSTSWLDLTLSTGRPSCLTSAPTAGNFWRETTSLVKR